MTSQRAFTMVEVAAVAAMIGIAAGIAVAGITAAVDSSRRDARMQALLEDLVRRRAEVLALTSPAEACLRVRLTNPKTLVFEERADCKDAATAKPAVTRTYDVSALSLPLPAEFCVDNLARVRDCQADPVEFEDVTLAIDADRRSGTDGTVTWSQSGRLSASFATGVDASAQPHLSDVGAAATASPTQTGGYSGLSTNPRGLLE